MTTLDSYVLRKFSDPFLYCFAGFVGIWFIFDLADNLQDFIQGQASAEALIDYYASQVPEIIVIALPLATLLALLYSLAGMSRSNEIISMLGAGRSVLRILMPLLAVGVLLTGVTAFFNYEGAPHATGMKKVIVGDIKRGKKSDKNIKAHLFRNREDHRTWFVSRMSLHGDRMQDVQIIAAGWGREHLATVVCARGGLRSYRSALDFTRGKTCRNGRGGKHPKNRECPGTS
jgi:lipopolysaccharide export LptBFGC system permease protein LptF